MNKKHNSNQFSRRLFLGGLTGGALSAQSLSTVSAQHSRDKRPPNIILIMADDLGYECLGCNGGTSYSTPNLDALASGGIRFTHAYSTPKCGPSRVCIMTGRYSFRNYTGWGQIPDDEITFGHMLKKAGYATALAGKWQLALLKDDPQHVHKMGFDEYCCWAWHEGPRYYQPMIWQNGKLLEGIKDEYGPDVYCGFLKDFIRRNQNKPFFAYYPMTLTHFAKTGGQYKEPKGPDGEYQTFDEMVAQMDRLVGELVDTLDDLGLRKNTLILFTGDNGTPKSVTSEWKGISIKGGKSELTDAGTHVPLIANWLGTSPPGQVCDDLIDFSDFFPTFADLAHAKTPDDRIIDGQSFALQLQGRPGIPRTWVYTEWEGHWWIRTKDWKFYDDGRIYNMKYDPFEKEPLPKDEIPPSVKTAGKRFRSIIEDMRSKAKA